MTGLAIVTALLAGLAVGAMLGVYLTGVSR